MDRRRARRRYVRLPHVLGHLHRGARAVGLPGARLRLRIRVDCGHAGRADTDTLAGRPVARHGQRGGIPRHGVSRGRRHDRHPRPGERQHRRAALLLPRPRHLPRVVPARSRFERRGPGGRVGGAEGGREHCGRRRGRRLGRVQGLGRAEGGRRRGGGGRRGAS